MPNSYTPDPQNLISAFLENICTLSDEGFEEQEAERVAPFRFVFYNSGRAIPNLSSRYGGVALVAKFG